MSLLSVKLAVCGWERSNLHLLVLACLAGGCVSLLSEVRAEGTPIGNWQVSQERDPIDDSQIVIASLRSSNTVVLGTHRPANLHIRCSQGETDVFVYWWNVISETEGRKEVVYRFPPQDAVEGVWLTSTDRKGTFVRINTIGFAREVGRAKRLVVRTEEVLFGHDVTAQFELAGSREALTPVAAACGWALSSTYVWPSALADRRAAPLLALYRATNGEGWTDNSNWLSSRPVGEWYGVETNGRGQVVAVDLYWNGLRGTIPSELGELKELEELALGSDELRGRIPPELGNLPRLRVLTLSHNQLSGPIPASLGELPVTLESLSLNGNRLTGGIPTELGQLRGLSVLRLDENALTGAIPVELGQLKHLTELDLADNHLTGQIPPELGQLTELRKLYLAGNRLNGCIPMELIEMGVDLRRFLTGKILHDLARIGLSTCPKPSGSLTSLGGSELEAPTWKGIGVSRHAIQSIFEKADNGGFVFKSGRLPDGTPRALAYFDKGAVLIRLIGSRRDLSSAYMSVRIGRNGRGLTEARVPQSLVLFAKHAAPSWKEGISWLERNIPAVRTGDAQIETRQGNLTIALRHRDGVLSLKVFVPEP